MFCLHEASTCLKIPHYLPLQSSQASGASLDTRVLRPGDLFIACPGQKVDGHDYLEEAFRRGAAGALIAKSYFDRFGQSLLSRPTVFKNILVADDVVKTLIRLAGWHRSQFKIPVIGITGSVGKTTTKDFLNYLMGKKWPGIATVGNLNNHLGVHLTLLRLNSSSRYCVCEMGASAPHEIRHLSQFACPTAGIITGISSAHLDGFGSLEKIYESKLELVEKFSPNAPVVFPDSDGELRKRLGRQSSLRLISVWVSQAAQYQLRDAVLCKSWIEFTVVRVGGFAKRFYVPGQALFLAFNAAMAMAMAEHCGVPMEEVSERWDDIELSGSRFQV